MICNGKQYAENTVFEGKIDFYIRPADALARNPIVDANGDLEEYAEVEALDEVRAVNGAVSVRTNKLKIGEKLSFAQMVQACLDFEYKKIDYIEEKNDDQYKYYRCSGSFPIDQIPEFWEIPKKHICSSKRSANIIVPENHTYISASGDSTKISSKVNFATISSSGSGTGICSQGNAASIGSSGDFTRICSQGDAASIGSSGDCTRICSQGNAASIGSSGDFTRICSSGEGAVICCAGGDSKVKAKIGTWITLSEWKYDEIKGRRVPVCVKTERVDGVRIKEDTFYTLKNGKFVEVQ